MTEDAAPPAGSQRPAEPMSLEMEPDIARELFGARVDEARAYVSHLALFGEELGLIGPLELPRLWTRHVINSVLVAPLLKPGWVADIGSGAGLPGIVLAIARPDVNLILIEPMERRVEWLRAESLRLGLTNVEVVRSRAEDARALPRFDQVTARAVSALSKLIPIAAPLARAGGELVLMKGASVEKEALAARSAIRKAKLSSVEILLLGDGNISEITRVFRATVD